MPAEFSWTEWHGHPSVVAGLLALTGGYLLGVGPFRRRCGWAQRVEPGQVTLFLLGVLVIFIALLSPLHELGDNYLFSAHMVQHLLLMLVAPPLLLLGTPGWLLRPLLRYPYVLRTARFMTRPVIAFVLFAAVLALWHMPALYELALRERNIHVLEHLMFIIAGVILWWPILSPMPEVPRTPYLGQIVYLFLQPTVPAVVGAVITFSDSVLYKWYADAPRVWDISAHSDQQVAGLIMWLPGGLVFMLTLISVFLVWAHQEESSAQRRRSSNVIYSGPATSNSKGYSDREVMR